MTIKKSKAICLLLLNMLDTQMSKIIDMELDENNNNNTNHDLVTILINTLDNIDEVVDILYKDVL